MAWPTLTDALLITEIRTLLGEPTPRRVTDAEITRWINKAVTIIAKRNLAAESTASFDLGTNTYEYATATTGLDDAIAIRAAIYTADATAATPETTARALLQMHPRHFSNIQASTAGAPLEWAFIATNFYVWPLPSSAENAKKLTVFYYRSPDIMTTDDFDNYIPAHYQPYLIWYAYAEALMKIGKPQQAMQYMSYFNNFIDFHRNNDRLYVGVDSEDMMKLPDRVEFVG